MVPAPESPVVVVSAVGTSRAVPDAVAVDLALEVVGDQPGHAVSEAAELLERLLEVLDAAGVAPADRRTDGLHVHPHHGHDGVVRGHAARYSLHVLTADVATAGRLVQAVADAAGEALRVHGFALTVRDPEPHRASARAQAVRTCRRQAEQLAEAAGVVLGPLQRLSEDESDLHLGAHSKSRTLAAGPAVQPGSTEVGIAVTATYALVLP